MPVPQKFDMKDAMPIEAEPPARFDMSQAVPIDGSTPTAPAPLSTLQRMKTNFDTNTQGAEHKPGESNVDRLKVDTANVGAGGGDFIRSLAHPKQLLKGMAQSVTPDEGLAGLAESALGPAGPLLKHTLDGFRQNPARALGNVGAGMILGEAGGAAAEMGARGVGAVTDTVKSGGTKALRSLTKTGPRQTAEFVAKTARENEAEIASTGEKNQKKVERVDEINARRKEINDRQQARYDAKKKAYDEAQAKAAEVEKDSAETETRRGELARRTKENSARLVERVKRVAAQTKGKLDQSYAQIREATKGQSVPTSDLRTAVENAQSKLKGSTESIKQFKDILSKAPDEDGPIEYQGSMIPKGHALYDVLSEGMESGKPFGFEDLRGYYSEIGEKLAPGDLLPDVYQALRSLQDSLDGMQKNLASKAGVGAKFSRTQAAYRDYMQSFREAQGPNHSGSPIASALQAKDPTFAIKPLTNADTAARVRNMLARFDPAEGGAGGAAQLYDNFLKDHREYEGLPKAGKVGKALTAPSAPIQKPMLQPRLEKPNVKVISPETAQQMKATNALGAADKMANSSSHFANTLAVLGALRSLISGDLGGLGVDIAVRGAYGVGKSAFAKALARPEVINAVTKLTAEDVAQFMRLPEDQRTGFVQVLQEADKRGVKLDPQVKKMIVGMGATMGVAGQKKGVAAALTP